MENLTNRRTLSLDLIVISISCALLLGFFLGDVNFKQNAFKLTTYYFIFFSFFLWVGLVLRDADLKRRAILDFLKDNWLGIAVSLVITIVFFLSLTARFRTPEDEVYLISGSQSMLLNKTPMCNYMGQWYYNSFHPLFTNLFKKPVFFPLLVSLVHTIRGYSAYNGFVLNFMASFLLFLNIFLLLKRAANNQRLAIAAVIMTASYPIISLGATSSSFEILNVLFMIISIRYFHEYLSCRTPNKLNKLLVTLVLLSQCRYEAAGMAIVIMAAVFWLELKERFKNISLITAVIPLLYISLIWQGLSCYKEQLDITHVNLSLKSPIPLFGLNYLSRNIPAFIRFFFYPVNHQPSNFFISYLALAGLIYAVVILWRNRTRLSFNDRVFFITGSLIFCSQFILILGTWCAGGFRIMLSWRLSIIFIPFFAFLASFFLAGMLERFKLSWCLIPVVAASFVLFHPIAIEDWHGNVHVVHRQHILDLNFLKRFPKSDNIFVIAHRPVNYPAFHTIHNYGACNISYANSRKREILYQFKRHLMTDIIVIQEIAYATGEPVKDDTLDKEYKLKTVYEVQNRPDSFRRYSIVEHE